MDDESLEYDEALEYDEDYESGETTGAPRARRWPRVLIAGGFVILAAAIVGGAIAIVGSLTHGFKKPVKVTYKTSAVFSLKAGDCFDPQGAQSYSLISCDAPHQAEVFATFGLTGTTWPGADRDPGGSQRRLREQAHRVREPAARDQPDVHLRVPGLRRVAGGDAHRDLRGAGHKRAAHRVGAGGFCQLRLTLPGG